MPSKTGCKKKSHFFSVASFGHWIDKGIVLVTMRTFSLLLLVLVLLSFDINYCVGSGLLRAPKNQEEGFANGQGDRDLTYYIGGKRFSGDTWYSDYKPHQIPRDWSKGDSPDFYRNNDKCYKNGTIKRSNCPTPPNCDFTGKHGKAKLCINRLPTPGGKWYVAAMGCVPHFENCDKCMCGTMVGSGKNGRCKLNRQDVPDDDQVEVDCYDLKTFKMNNHRVHIG